MLEKVNSSLKYAQVLYNLATLYEKLGADGLVKSLVTADKALALLEKLCQHADSCQQSRELEIEILFHKSNIYLA